MPSYWESTNNVVEEQLLPEITDNGQIVRIAYRSILGREPDPVGFDNWITQMARGMTHNNLFSYFLFCPEFKQKWGGKP